MELNFHWKTFRTVFLTYSQSTSNLLEPLYIVAEKRTIIALFSDTEDLSDWIGSTYEELLDAFPQRNFIIYPREKVDHWLEMSLSQSHFYDQALFLREQAKSYLANHPEAIISTSDKGSLRHFRIDRIPEHFLLKALNSWWLKILPEYYAIYLDLSENHTSWSLLVFIQRGKVITFQVPDFTSISKTNPPSLRQRIEFLKSRHLIPIQGISVAFQQWKEWSSLENPWHQIVHALKKDKQKVIPQGFGIQLLIRTKSFLGI
jgi:hypothetical protein